MIWATILQFLSANALRIAMWAALAGIIAFGVHRITLSYSQSAELQQQQQLIQQANDKNKAELEKLKSLYDNSIQAVTQQRDKQAKSLAYATKQLEAIKHADPKDDGSTRRVIVDALDGMREQSNPDAN